MLRAVFDTSIRQPTHCYRISSSFTSALCSWKERDEVCTFHALGRSPHTPKIKVHMFAQQSALRQVEWLISSCYCNKIFAQALKLDTPKAVTTGSNSMLMASVNILDIRYSAFPLKPKHQELYLPD